MENNKITREGLKELHDIACSTWKQKLENIANRNPFNCDITVSDDEINEMFTAADEKQLKVVKKYFTKPESIIDKVKSYEDACKLLSINCIPRSAYDRLKIIIKALNGGWKPDFNNPNQYKYYNWFKMRNGEFVFDDTYYSYGYVSVPSTLYLKSNELTRHASKIALKEYEEFYLEE
jgi:hypothetical protein